MLLRRYRLSPRTRLVASAQERFLVCDHPLQWIRLNETAWQLLRALDGDGYLHERVSGVTPEAVDYLESLTERGVLKADYRLRWPEEWPLVRVIVPAYGDPHRLRNCLESLGRLDYPAERFAVTVVDDGSPEPLEQALGSDRGAGGGRGDWGDMGLGGRLRWQRLERNRGPADARNAAALAEPAAPAESADTLLAFVDSDCEVAPDWLRQLAAVLEEPSLAAAGGRVTGMGGHSLLARYEGACSSLDMGSRPGRVGVRGAPVPYLPSCNLAVRAGAFRRAGGFTAAWRTGEDVDFCWRLVAGGGRLFYWPEAAVAHDHRERWGSFLARKRDYGRSEGPLGARHPARFAVGGPGWLFRGALIAAGAALWSGSGWAAGATLALPPVVEALRRLAALRRWPAGIGWPRLRAAAESMARLPTRGVPSSADFTAVVTSARPPPDIAWTALETRLITTCSILSESISSIGSPSDSSVAISTLPGIFPFRI